MHWKPVNAGSFWSPWRTRDRAELTSCTEPLLSSANRLLHTQSRCFSFRLMELLQTISLPKRKHQHSWKLEGLISIIGARCQQHQPWFINKNPRTEQQLHFGLACLKENPHKPTFSSLRGPLGCIVLCPTAIDFCVREKEINLLLFASLLLCEWRENWICVNTHC